jgi:DNA-binding MarR family transcriptional regulator
MIQEYEDVRKLFFKKRPLRILLALWGAFEGANIRTIARKSDCEYAHVHRMLKTFEYLGLVRSSKIGRDRRYTLEELGQLCAKHFSKIINPN